MKRSATPIAVGIILVAYLTFGLIYGATLPPFENLDEIEHFGVIRYVADTGDLPVHGRPAEEDVYHYRQEASQPPLYHLLSAGWVRLLGLRTDDAGDFWRFNARVVCGPGGAGLYDNRAIFYHDPNREAFPWRGTLLTVHVLRVWSTLLQAVTVLGTYLLARRAFPERRGIGLVAMAVVAFNPQFLLVASGVNNDNLLTPLVTIGLYLVLTIWQEGLTPQLAVSLGIVSGLAGLTKLSGWLLVALAGLVVLVRLFRFPERRFRRALIGLVIPAVALLIGSWWFWRNWQLYGDPTALEPMLDLVGRRSGSLLQPIRELGWMFRSFWGQIPCSFYPPGFYVFYGILSLLAVGGLIWVWRRLTTKERWITVGLGCWILIITLSWMRWDAMTPAPGGRLLFPALPVVALLIGLGVTGWMGRKVHWISAIVIVLLALMVGWTVGQILPGFFAPPPRYPRADAVPPNQSLDATLGDAIRLHGYDVALNDRGPILDLTLYWEATAPITEDYVVALQLVSPVVGDTSLRWNYNSWPGRGNYPTSAWQLNEIIADRYRFQLPEGDHVTQAWDLHVVLYEGETGERLPIQLDGTDVGDQLMLTRLRVPGRSPDCPELDRLAADVRIGDGIALTHATVITQAEQARVTLCWKALQPVPVNYTVFVHLVDGNGALISTGDGPPMNGAFPTSMWQPGDVILDTHYLPLPEQGLGTDERITVGHYWPEDGTRPPVFADGSPLPANAIPVWPDRP